MIKIENFEVVGLKHAIRGMRNPKNSWANSDSECLFHMFPNWPEGKDPEVDKKYNAILDAGINLKIGPKDHKLMMSLSKGGPVHAKYRRMIAVYADITAPLFWWKEFDTYKVGTVRNSCSTMHTIHLSQFSIDMFAHEGCDQIPIAKETLDRLIVTLEWLRLQFNETQDRKYWRALIELLPDGFMMKATIMMNYEVAANIYQWRKKIPHKLDEWRVFGEWLESLPYSEIFTCEEGKDDAT